MEFVITLHALCLLILSLYALHQAYLLSLYWRTRKTAASAKDCQVTDRCLPPVTVQIPLYNERTIAERIIAAAASQTYPRHALHIQVLDDSTDDTTRIARRAIDRARRQGVDIELIHRTHRLGYKAGALTAGLNQAKGDFIAIFDADFVPKPDFLVRLMTECDSFADPAIGFVQTRWDYLNRDASPLTRAQAMTLDVHFIIEQPARSGNGLMMNFNGSGGVWRRSCICDAGGWASDTMTEDLDLSYRAGLRGWRGVYLADESAPSELPADVLAYKRQQARWARGTLQTVCKLVPQIMRSSKPLHVKLAACMHLTGYFIHPLMLVISITTPLLILRTLLGPVLGLLSIPVNQSAVPMWVNAISLLSFAPIVSMGVAHSARGRTFWQFIRDLPASLMFGIGTSFSTTIGMLSALLDRHTGDWTPTPKSAGKVGMPKPRSLRPDWTMWIELGLAVYAAITLFVIVQAGLWYSVFPMMLYVLGFGGVWLQQVLSALDGPAQRGT